MFKYPGTLKLLAALLLTFFLSGCMEKTSDQGDEIYELWSGVKPSSDVKIIHGKYRESAHWSKEYVMFIEMKASKEWVEAFVKQNNLKLDTAEYDLSNVPDWFTPAKGFFTFRPENDAGGSRYYFNLKEDRVFIYEVQF